MSDERFSKMADDWLRTELEYIPHPDAVASLANMLARVARKERDQWEQDATRYRALMAVRERAGWKEGSPCACVFHWDTNALLHECTEHEFRREEEAREAREDCAQICDAHASIEGIAQQCAADIRAARLCREDDRDVRKLDNELALESRVGAERP